MSKCENCKNKIDASLSNSTFKELTCHSCLYCDLTKKCNFEKKKVKVKKWRWVAKDRGSEKLWVTSKHLAGNERSVAMIFIQKIDSTEIEVEE